MVVFLSLLVCIIGLLVYALSSNAKVAELGRIAFGCGLLAFLLQASPQMLSILK